MKKYLILIVTILFLISSCSTGSFTLGPDGYKKTKCKVKKKDDNYLITTLVKNN